MKILDQIANSGTVILITDNPISEISNIQLNYGVSKETLTPITTATSPVYYQIVADTAVQGRALIKIFNLNTGTCYLFSATVFTNPGIEFWNDDFNAAGIDTVYQGGTWSNGVIMDALGVNPEDLIVDGDAFMSPSVSYAPEELVPGHTAESIGINVYTKGPDSYATMISSSFDVIEGQTATITLSAFPDAYAGIRVYFDNRTLDRSTSSVNLSADQFFIDGRYLVIPPQTSTGKGGYTYLRIGGTGLIDYNSTNIPKGSFINYAIVDGLISYDDAESVFVLVNGQEINAVTTSSSYGYMVKRNFNDNYRASVYVYNLNTASNNNVEAWFFNVPNNQISFNKINEEISVISTSTSSVLLSFPPGGWEPYSDKAIVEISASLLSTDRKRLIPPYVSNYYKSDNNLTYFIDNRYDNMPLPYLTGIVASNVYVYVNGTMIRRGYDYTINLANYTITLTPNLYPDGVYLSVTTDKQGIGNEFDYIISNNILRFYNSSGPVTITNTNLKVTTFRNHDNLFMNNEFFYSNGLNLYQLEYPAQDENYVWVYVDGKPLIHRYDFDIMADAKTLRFSDHVVTTATSIIMVTSIKNPANLNKVYGYRMFKDFAQRDHFKRLSKANTTFLLENLKFYDNKIKIFDSAVLSPPNVSKNVPGVVLIDRERVEFFNHDFDELQDLRRGTLGTSPAFYIDEGAKVIDQGIMQTIPYYESTYFYSTLTTTASVYTIPFYKGNATALTMPYYQNTSGITLNTSSIISATDQVNVFYGGNPLKKSSYEKYYEKINDNLTIPAEFSVDIINTLTQISTTSSSATIFISGLLSNEVFKASFLLTTATNTTSYWTSSTVVYNSTSSSTGYIGTSSVIWSTMYDINSGTMFRFDNLYGTGVASTLTISLLYQHLSLNIRDRLVSGVHLYLTKKEGYTWAGNESMLTSNDSRSTFIREQEAELPDVYYYGGDPRLLDQNNVPLTDDNGVTLTRY